MRLGVSNVFILSAGWGLVRADYPLPVYDITVAKPAKSADSYKWRRPTDEYHDFCHLHAGDPGPIILMAPRLPSTFPEADRYLYVRKDCLLCV